MPAWLGAHPVSVEHTWAVARVLGVFSTLWAVAAGAWLMGPPGKQILHSDAWHPMLTLVGDYRWVGATILGGGILGILGLALRRRWISIASCVVGIGWSGWVLSFAWWSNFQGYYSMSSFFGILSGAVFVFRFWLLARTPQPGDDVVHGW